MGEGYGYICREGMGIYGGRVWVYMGGAGLRDSNCPRTASSQHPPRLSQELCVERLLEIPVYIHHTIHSTTLY